MRACRSPTSNSRALYPDRTTYLARYEAAVQACLDAGFLLPREAEQLLVDARSDDGRRRSYRLISIINTQAAPAATMNVSTTPAAVQ